MFYLYVLCCYSIVTGKECIYLHLSTRFDIVLISVVAGKESLETLKVALITICGQWDQNLVIQISCHT